MSKTYTLSGVVVGPNGVQVHPDFWEDLAKAPEEVQAAAKQFLENLKQVSEVTHAIYGPNASIESFNKVFEEVTGEKPIPLNIDEEDDETLRMIESRTQMPTKQ